MLDEPKVQVTEPITPAGEGETQPVAAPEVTPAGEVQEATAVSEEDEMRALETELAQAETKEAKQAVQSKINKRFNEVTRKRHEAELELAKWKGRAEALAETRQVPEVKPVEAPKPPELVLPPRPKKSDFTDAEGYEDPDAYEEARDEWVRKAAIAEYEHQKRVAETQVQQEKLQSDREIWLNTGREKFPDFDDVVRKIGQKAAQILGPAISESEMGHELAYYLGNNPKEASRLSSLSPISAAREIGKLEIQLAKPPAKKTTEAAAPIRPITGGEVSVDRDITELSMDEYAERRMRQLYGPNWRPRA